MNLHLESSPEIAKEFPIDVSDPRYEIGEIFREYGPAYQANHRLNPVQHQVITDLGQCRTAALGAHVDECDHCKHLEISYNSCRNRHCPKCQGRQRVDWVDAREMELLPIEYFHFVFTLPQKLLPWVRFNPTVLYGLLMKTAAETLQTFAQKKWGGKLGIIMVLHTWGQTLNEHPHVHCIVTGGVLKTDGSDFIQAPSNYLFSVEALSRVFREKYLAGFKRAQQAGQLPRGSTPHNEAEWKHLLDALYQHDWVVYAKKTCKKPEHLLRYIGRYINRVAISNHRIESIDNGHVTFRYHDNRDDQDKKMTLSAAAFIRRFLSHVLPKGFRRIRYYGFLVNSQRQQKLIQCRKLLHLDDPEKPYIADMDYHLTRLGQDMDLCPACGQGHLHTIELIAPHHDPPEKLPQVA